MEKELLTVREGSAYFSKCPNTIRNWIKRGEIPHTKIGRNYYIKKEDLEEHINNNSFKPLHKDLIPKLKIVLDRSVGHVTVSVKGESNGMNKKMSRCNLGVGSVYPRFTKKGNVRWWTDYKNSEGRRVQHVIKHAQTQDEAVHALLKEVQDEYEKKYQPNKNKKKIKFNEFADMYVESYAKTNKRSWKTDDYYLRFMRKFFKKFCIHEISSLDIEKYRTERLKQGVKPSTVNRCLAILRKMLNLAVDWGFLENNQMSKVKLYSEKDNFVEKKLTNDEQECLLEASSERLRSIILVALNTGMRLGEILNLQWSQVDLDNERIRVEKTKSGKIRVVDINSFLMEKLVELKSANGDSGYLFLNPKTGKPLTTVKTAFKAACRRAGIKGLRFHDLRHAFASRLIAKGVDIITVKELLGHSSVKVTERYTHTHKEQKKKAVELLADESKKKAVLLHYPMSIILMNKLFSLIRFSIFEHIINDLYKLPGKSIHGLRSL